MKNGILYIMVGTPGSGKSTFVKNHINHDTDIVVSRDVIRFSMVPVEDEYFSKEKQVFKEYAKQINNGLAKGKNVFADATHLSAASRRKLLRAISAVPSEVQVIWLDTPLDTCLENNEKRRGTRSYVPRGQLHRMHCQIEEPDLEEGFNMIYIVKPDSPIIIKKPWRR